MFNLTNLKSIESDPVILNQFLQVFFKTTKEDLENLNTAIIMDNNQQITHLAHRIRGSALLVGAEKLVDLAGALESNNFGSPTKTRESLYTALMAEFENLCRLNSVQ